MPLTHSVFVSQMRKLLAHCGYDPKAYTGHSFTRLVKETLDRPASHQPNRDAVTPHPIVRRDLIDNEGNLHAADIGTTWQGSETFLHGVRVVGPNAARPPLRSQPATSTPYVPVREHVPCHMSTPPPIQPSCVEVADRPLHRTTQEGRQGYRPAAPIQRFNNKSLNWPSWFRHFKAVADVHGWDKDQRVLQLVSYLNKTAMELADDELYDYWVTDSTLHLGFLLPDLDSMAGRDATTRMQTLMPTPLPSCAAWDTHRAHRNYARNSLANNLSWDSRTPN